jgi:hypothetical protein
MTKTRYSLDRAISQFTLGKLPYSDLPDVARDALELGIDGPAIRRLASLHKPSYFGVGDLFDRALREMGIEQWSKRDAAVFLAREIGRDILAGKKEPLGGAEEIWELCVAADYPKELTIFGELDQEFNIPQLLEEYRILVAKPQRTYFSD